MYIIGYGNVDTFQTLKVQSRNLVNIQIIPYVMNELGSDSVPSNEIAFSVYLFNIF